MNTIKLTDTHIDLDSCSEENARRAIIDAAADRADELIELLTSEQCAQCTHALLTALFALDIIKQYSPADADPQDITAIRHNTLREVLRMAGIESTTTITPINR